LLSPKAGAILQRRLTFRQQSWRSGRRPCDHNQDRGAPEHVPPHADHGSEQKRWKEAAALRGQTLSELVRTAIEAELVTPVITARAGVTGSSVSPQAQPARARAEKTLEEKLQALGELVDGLGSGR
jgi:hypothetical protein